MARKEDTGLIEQHVEKIALGIALVILVVAGLHWGLESPRRIKLGINARGVGMPEDEYPPDEVDGALETASGRLEDWLENGKKFPGRKRVPDYVGELKGIYESPYNAERVHSYVYYRQPRRLPNLDGPDIKQAEPTSLAVLVTLPKPEKPLVKIRREVQVSITPERETKYKEIKIGHGVAVFDHGKVLKEWKQALEKTHVSPGVTFFAVEARRRYLLPDGSWSESEPVAVVIPKLPEIPVADGKNFPEIQEKINELARITNQEYILEPSSPDIVWPNRRTGTWQIEHHKARTRVSNILEIKDEKSTAAKAGRRLEVEPRLARDADRRRREEARKARDDRRREEEAREAARRRQSAATRRPGEGRTRRPPKREDRRERRPSRREDRRERRPDRRPDEERRDPGRRTDPERRRVAVEPDAPKLILTPTLQEQLDNPAGILEVWFHDTNLNDGMTYSYQLRMVLVNPLLGRFKDVANKDDAKVQFVHTPWSQWSDAVSVKSPTEFFLVGSASTMGTVTVEVFTQRWGQRVSHSFRIGEGVPIGGDARKELLRLDGGEQENAMVSFKTGAIAVSFNFNKKQRVPGMNYSRETTELLYLDANGKLCTRTQFEDESSPRYKELHNEVLQSTRTASGVQ